MLSSASPLVVPQATRSLVRTVLPFASFFPRVPDLHLGGSAQINPTIRPGIEAEVDHEFHITIVLDRAKIRPMAIIVNHPVFDLPVRGKHLTVLLALGRNFLGIPELDVVMGVLRPPTTEILTVIYRAEAIGSHSGKNMTRGQRMHACH